MPLIPPLITHTPNAQQLYLSAGGSTPTVPTVTAEQFTATGTGAVSGFVVTSSGGNNFVADCNPNPATASALTINREGITRWSIDTFGDEAGANAGSDLYINAYSDAGAPLQTRLNIDRSSGDVNVASGNFAVGSGITKKNIDCGNLNTFGVQMLSTPDSGGVAPAYVTLIQPRQNYGTTGISMCAAMPFNDVPIAGANYVFSPLEDNVNFLNMITTNQACIGTTGFATGALGATISIFASPTSTGVFTMTAPNSVGAATTLFTFDTAVNKNIIYTIYRVGNTATSGTDWVYLVSS